MSELKTCCFTGHRPKNLPFGYNENDERCIKLKNILQNEIESLIVKNNVGHFITGMALGIDLICAEIVLELKKKYPAITLESAIPCETQAVKWSEKQRNRYSHIGKKCDKVTLIQHHYDKECIHNRNKYMVDSSDFVLAVWSGNPSGTGNTVRYAKEKGKRIIIINPLTLDTKR